MSDGIDQLEIEFICEYCDNTLDVDYSGGWFSHERYHKCHGEVLKDVAMDGPNGGIRVLTEGVSVEVADGTV
jgi:hypothetical protein